MDTLDLSEFFKTKGQATDFSVRLATISEKIYQTGFSLEQTLQDQFGIQKKDKFMALLRDNSIRIEAQSDLKGFLDKVQETISTMQVLSMTVAYDPKDQTLQALSEWFLMNLKKQILLDIQVDTQVIGGAVISFNGKHGDFSLKPRLEQVMNDAQNEKMKPVQKDEQQTPPPSQHDHQDIETMHMGR